MIIRQMTPELASRIYGILYEKCGAPTGLQPAFLTYFYFNRNDVGLAFRFSGALGAGGKFHWDADGTIRVACYPEDETPERLAMISRAMPGLKN